MAGADPGRAGLEQIVRGYLSPQHREMLGDGYLNAALLDGVGRSIETTRQAYTDDVLILIEGIAERMAPADPSSARVKALSLLALMAGTLQLSRAPTDTQLANELLEQGIDNALDLLDAGQRV
ncbi:TetR/AcrR family transcriptional regulator [Streptomyces sp. NPDC086033]|uniref:TetR/AcrR family transcriptional regulator n=1 Tax=Streptomyces sp. NPDC086033 TaxID=3365747 RepID=UPI0037CE9B5A